MTAFEKMKPAWMAIYWYGFKAGRETDKDIDTAFNEWWNEHGEPLCEKITEDNT